MEDDGVSSTKLVDSTVVAVKVPDTVGDEVDVDNVSSTELVDSTVVAVKVPTTV
jgi:hypothetical protein